MAKERWLKMISEEQPAAPRWAGRVSKRKIAQIYQDDASGMHDEELLNDVAYTLLARCKSMLIVEEARNGRATCPICDAVVNHEAKKDCLLACVNCNWTGSWNDYRASMDGLHLLAPGLQPFCREYVQRLPLVKTSKEKMFWIDWLIHRCHWEGTALPGQPGAVCLIKGRAQDVNAFLDALSAGTLSPQNVDGLGQLWSSAQKEQIQKWRNASDRRKQKKENNP